METKLDKLLFGSDSISREGQKNSAGLINARAETVAVKPAFRTAFKKRRCLIPADGFYEWRKFGMGMVPHRARVADGMFFSPDFGALERSRGGPLKTCSIITTTPNELTAPIHDRMPVILPSDRRAAWLDPRTSPEELQSFLIPFDASKMEAYPISSRVGSPKNNDAGIIERLATTGDFLVDVFPDPL